MTDRKPDFKLTEEIAKRIILLLGPDGKSASPTDICNEIGINRRTFNSAISKVVFAKNPTMPEAMLRMHILEIHTRWYHSLPYGSPDDPNTIQMPDFT